MLLIKDVLLLTYESPVQFGLFQILFVFNKVDERMLASSSSLFKSTQRLMTSPLKRLVCIPHLLTILGLVGACQLPFSSKP
jgi:hypothetical protein